MKFITALMGLMFITSSATLWLIPYVEKAMIAYGTNVYEPWMPFLYWYSILMQFGSSFYFVVVIGFWIANLEIWGKIRKRIKLFQLHQKCKSGENEAVE